MHPMFTAALFSTAKTRKQPKHPSTEEQIKKMRYIYTMHYYSAIKRNERMPLVTAWTQLQIISLSEKQTAHISTSVWNLKDGTNKLI